MTYRGKPILYVRVSRGGRQAADAHELRLRGALEAAGIPMNGAHLYCDIDTPRHCVGRALGLLLQEASLGRVGTVVVQSLGSFGCYELIVYALLTLERGSSNVLVAGDIINDVHVADGLRNENDSPLPAPRMVVRGGALASSLQLMSVRLCGTAALYSGHGDRL